MQLATCGQQVANSLVAGNLPGFPGAQRAVSRRCLWPTTCDHVEDGKERFEYPVAFTVAFTYESSSPPATGLLRFLLRPRVSLVGHVGIPPAWMSSHTGSPGERSRGELGQW